MNKFYFLNILFGVKSHAGSADYRIQFQLFPVLYDTERSVLTSVIIYLHQNLYGTLCYKILRIKLHLNPTTKKSN